MYTKTEERALQTTTARRRDKRRLTPLLLIPLLLGTVLAVAAVFVYYPGSMTVQQTAPPVVFQLGANAGQPDLGSGNTIAVSIGANQTSVTMTLHPTYQKTYYQDILRIVNNDVQAYYLYIRVNTPASLPTGGSAVMYVNGVPVDLTVAGTTQIGIINGGTTWQVDVEFYFPEGVPLTTTSVSFDVIYSPEAATPP